MNRNSANSFLSFFLFQKGRGACILFFLIVAFSSNSFAQSILYSYQSGNWETSTTWTTDPSGTLSVNPAVPSNSDNVVILNGRTVTSTTNGKLVASTQINSGGTLDLTNTTGHNFGVVSGQGYLKLSSNTFPA